MPRRFTGPGPGLEEQEWRNRGGAQVHQEPDHLGPGLDEGSAGDTLADALRSAKEAVECHLEGILMDGERFPQASENIQVGEGQLVGIVAIDLAALQRAVAEQKPAAASVPPQKDGPAPRPAASLSADAASTVPCPRCDGRREGTGRWRRPTSRSPEARPRATRFACRPARDRTRGEAPRRTA